MSLHVSSSLLLCYDSVVYLLKLCKISYIYEQTIFTDDDVFISTH
jgi:hypothetical protein